MKNLLTKGYLAIDETIMKGVNLAVRAYNWTTGDTKAGLANTCLALSVVSASLYPLVQEKNNYFAASIVGAFLGSVFYLQARGNREMENLEIKARNDDLLNSVVEEDRVRNMVHGPIISAIPFASEIANPDLGFLPIRVGALLYGSSLYVMRADSPATRKDFVSRGVENILLAYEENKRSKQLG